MKKKLVSLVMTGAMFAGLVAGCGSDGGADSTADQNSGVDSKASSEAAADSEELYEVVMQWPSAGDTPSSLEAVEAAVNEMVADLGVKVKLEPVGAYTIASDTSLAISSGEKLDLVCSMFSGVGNLASSGGIIPLDEYLEEYGQDIVSVCGELQMKAGLYDGQTYGIPVHYADGSDMGFVVRKDLMEKYVPDFDEDKFYNFDELTEMFTAIKEGEGENFYIMAGGYNSDTLFQCVKRMDLLGQGIAGGVLFVDGSGSTTVVNPFATEEYAEFAQLMYEWNQAGFFPSDAATNTESYYTQIGAGNFLGAPTGDTAGTTAPNYSAAIGREVTFIKTSPAVSMSTAYNMILWSISSTSENPAKAMTFLNEIYANADLANLLQYGFEGETYEVVESDDKGTVIQLKEGLTTMTAPYWQNFYLWGDRLQWYIMAPDTTDANERCKAFEVDTISPALGYTFKIDNVSAQYSAVDSVIQQYLGIVQTGSIDPAQELPEFLQALEDAGYNEVIAENQRQLDAWLAEQ